MASSIYSIGLSGLAAAQAGLVTTGHNIANVNTAGYSRQEALQGASAPQFLGGHFFGRGVDVTAVRRVYSDFLAAQSLATRAEANELQALSTELSQLDNLFGDPSAGLSPALNDFFAGVNGVAAHPAHGPSRQAMLASANALVARFRQIDGQLDGFRQANEGQVRSAVTAINGYVQQIAGLNQRITEVAYSAASGQPPSDLLDQRDQLVQKLNELIGARAVQQADGTYNVFLASGQALVVGKDAYAMQAVTDTNDPRRLQVALSLGGAGAPLRLASSDIEGGKLAGILAYRDGPLTEAQNELGRIAVVFADAFNRQHRLGVDLDGQPGGNVFSAPAPTWYGAATNTGSAALSVAIAGTSALTASDYRLAYDGANWTVTRLADATTQTFATLPQTVDGVTFAVASGAAAAGDSFLVQPTRYAARDLAMLITDPGKIAAAAPIVTATAAANTGSGTITAGAVNAAYLAAPLGAPVTLTYNAGPGTLTGFPATQPVTVTAGGSSTTYAAGAPVPYTAGALVSFGGIEIAIAGAPAGGDTFTVGPNANGVGDNRNAQRLASLADANLVAGSTTLSGALGQITANVGAATHEASIEQQAQAALLEQVDRAMQSVSGVNLDEEAANLQRFQQAYQAAGQVMRIAGSLFDTILEIGA
jgi:flagellar hook-associated protein 1 FlgK